MQYRNDLEHETIINIIMNRRSSAPHASFVPSILIREKPSTGLSNGSVSFHRNYSLPCSRSIRTAKSIIRTTATIAPNRIRIGVLVSGGGRSLANLHERIQSGSLRNVEICVVLSSKTTAGATELAKNFNLPVHVLNARDYKGKIPEWSAEVTKVLDKYQPDLVVMAGWLHFYQIPSHYFAKVINIHPSLIPAFCGKGYYGDRVHRAVVSEEHSIQSRATNHQSTSQLEFGAKISGCTVHFADNEYDHGPIILQKSVAVHDSDTVEVLAARVFEAEKEALPEALQLIADSRLEVNGRIVKVLEESSITSR